MLARFTTATMLLAAAFVLLPASADDAPAKENEEKFSAKCPLSGQDAKEVQFTAYKDGKVYFCCDKCKAAFEKDSTKHAVKANAQLVATKQYVQKKCPFTGGPLKSEPSEIGKTKTKVQFCCNKCKKKADEAEGDDQLAMIFGEDAFKKGFEKKK